MRTSGRNQRPDPHIKFLEILYAVTRRDGYSLQHASTSQLRTACGSIATCWERRTALLTPFLVTAVPLYVIALRETTHTGSSSWLQELRSLLGQVLSSVVEAHNDVRAHDQASQLALALLRSDTFQVYAQMLAMDYAELSAAASSNNIVNVDVYYSHYQDLCLLLQNLAIPAVNAASPHRRVVRRALLSALADSQVLEHAARLRLGLQEWEARQPQAQAQSQTSQLHDRVLHVRGGGSTGTGSTSAAGVDSDFAGACDMAFTVMMAHLLQDIQLPTACTTYAHLTVRLTIASPIHELSARQRSQLRSVLSGPCLQALLGWQLAAAAPGWGLPAGLRQRQAPRAQAVERATQTAGTVWLGLLVLDEHEQQSAASGARSASPSTAAGRQQGAAPQQVPYRVGQALSLLRAGMAHVCNASCAVDIVTLEMAAGCLAAGWRRMRPVAAADCLRELWAQLLPALRRACGAGDIGGWDAVERHARVGGMLMAVGLASPTAGGDGGPGGGHDGSPAAADGGQVATALSGLGGVVPSTLADTSDRGTEGVASHPQPFWSLRCALDAGLLRTVEGALRAEKRTPTNALCMIIDLLLRRPGVWPAVVAHGPPDQVAALIVTVRKVVAVATSAGRPVPHWHLTVRSLLEQAAAALAEMGERSHARGGPAQQRDRNPGFAQTTRLCRQLHVNRHFSDAAGASVTRGLHPPTARLCTGPVWEDVARAGGCPAAGSPAAEQLQRLAVFAAAQWLPGQFIKRSESGAMHCFPLSNFTAHHSHMVLLHWLLLAAEQSMHTTAPSHSSEPASGHSERDCGGDGLSEVDAASGIAAHLSWMYLLTSMGTPLMVFANPDWPILPETEEPLMDIAERLVIASPQLAAELLAKEAMNTATHGPAVCRSAIVPLLERHGRLDMLATLEELVEFGRVGGVPEGWEPQRLLASMQALPGLSPLPPPRAAVEALRVCDNPACVVMNGDSEADVQLLTCGGCRAARYCCAACQRQHWREEHKEECRSGR